MMIYEYICWFFLYSVMGWIYESILLSFLEKRWINRGFLNGPYCPIYGFGAILNIMFLDGTQNIIVMFYFGMVLTCTLEYFTSWSLEKLFHAKWWDYSERRYNLNGRICLLGAIVFGTFSVLLVYLVHPMVVQLTNTLSNKTLFVIALMIVCAIAVDCSITVMSLLGFNRKLRLVEIRLEITELRLQLAEIKSLILKLNLQERRILRAFPKLKSTRYNDSLQLIREAFKNIIWRYQNK